MSVEVDGLYVLQSSQNKLKHFSILKPTQKTAKQLVTNMRFHNNRIANTAPFFVPTPQHDILLL